MQLYTVPIGKYIINKGYLIVFTAFVHAVDVYCDLPLIGFGSRTGVMLFN